MKECACCPTKLVNTREKYCSNKCRRAYKNGSILLANGTRRRRFNNFNYTLKVALSEAISNGDEFVTVRFDD